MGKHIKLTPKRAPRAASATPPADTSAADVDGTLREVLELLQMLLRTVKGASAKEITPALLRESSGVARAIVQLSGEQRSRRKLWVREARSLNRAMVMEYLRALPELERHNVVRELTEYDEGGSVLA